MSLGSASAIEAGNLALAAGGMALLVVMAHVGIGFQLRNPQQRKRSKLRRQHQITAATIVVFSLVHALWLLLARVG